MPFCTYDETLRIIDPQNASDYLLQLRANTVADNMRLFRVYRNYKILNEGTDWTFENSFVNIHFINFFNLLNDDEREKCNSITYGNIFSNDPNGYIWSSNYGPILTVSDALSYFLKFANLGLMDFNGEVPDYIRFNALRISLRIMLKTETMDFLMDPRGIIPNKINESITDPINYQLEFIAGHEFGHYLLGHLDGNNTVSKPVYSAITSNDLPYGDIKVFNENQKQEFEADLFSLEKAENQCSDYIHYYESSLIWFGALELYEALTEVLYPKPTYSISTHPSAKERFFNILDNATPPKGFKVKEWLEFFSYIEYLKELIVEDATINCDMYETYGSLYLDEPNSKWRGKELIDRVHYY